MVWTDIVWASLWSSMHLLQGKHVRDETRDVRQNEAGSIFLTCLEGSLGLVAYAAKFHG